MNQDKKDLLDLKNAFIKRFPRFATQIASANLEYRTDLPFHTAATDGKNIYFDPDYLTKLSDDEKVFIIAHELMHIKFEHMYRMVDKNGKVRDAEIWNIATDAIINANLQKDGFKIQEGAVNMPEAIRYTAEEFYDKLMREKQEEQSSPQNESESGDEQSQQDSKKQSKENNSSSKQNKENTSNKEQNKEDSLNKKQDKSKNDSSSKKGQDDHSLWEEAFEERKNEKSSKKHNSKQDVSAGTSGNETDTEKQEFKEYDEKAEFEKSRIERRNHARELMEKLKNSELGKINNNNEISFGKIGEAEEKIDWKILIRREFEKTETIWSQRRSIAENNYAYRLEENDIEDEAETEVMIDVSGSVPHEMIKAFLRQLKLLLKNSKLKVGFFADYATNKFQEIKTVKDIDNLKIHQPGFGTNIDAAARAFSRKKEINKIVFTDGYSNDMPKEDLEKVNIIWIVYENKEFSPCCGKVIFVEPKELMQSNDEEIELVL